MTFLRPKWAVLFFFALAPVTSNWREWKPKIEPERMPAETSSQSDCRSLARDLFISKYYEINHEAALAEKKLITFSNKFVTVQHPKMDWINRMRISLNKSLRNWNNNRYPSFYMLSDEDIVPTARGYYDSLEKILTEQLPLTKEQTENQALINAWIKSYEDYNADVDKLLEERISLQYNLTLLKKLKMKEESRDIKLMIKRDGKMTEEIFTLRKEDKNLGHLVHKLKGEIAELDGTLLRNGKIKDRIIRQAMLQDILTILHRELEHAIKNGQNVPEQMTKELEKLEALIKNPEFKPTTYGIYRVTNKQFMSEVYRLSKLNLVVEKVKEPITAMKNIFANFLQSRSGTPALDKPAKEGIFRRIYNKITNITPKQAAYGTAGAGVLAYGTHQYFYVSKSNTVEEVRGSQELLEESEKEQLERTLEEETKKSEGHSEVIELEMEELTK